jgi:hypothetical protein
MIKPGGVVPERRDLRFIQGEKGDIGPEGPAGAASTVPGPKGDDGDSAYQLAVSNGFVGTEVEWLASLQGADGIDGEDGADATVTDANVATVLHAAATKGTPVDADEISFLDSVAAFALKKLTFANLWAWIKTKTDPLYALADVVTAATSYTLTTADHGKHLRFSATSGTVTVTIDSTSLFEGFFCVVRQDAAAQVQIVAGTGTMRCAGTGKTRAFYSSMSVIGRRADIGYVDGDMSAS